MWQNSTEVGSPPCSPQIPQWRFGLTVALPSLDSHFHELANASLVELSERVVLEDLLVIVSVEELTCIVTAEAVSHLSKVVSTEAEEFSFA